MDMKKTVANINEDGKGSEKTAVVEQVFTDIAPVYDAMNSRMSMGLHHGWRRFSVKKAQVKKGMTVLDVCTGTCDFSLELAKAVGPEGHVTASDYNQSMLLEGQKKVDRSPYAKNFKLVRANTCALPFPDNHFDVVTVSCGIRNTPDIALGFAEMARVCKPGGRVVCLDLGHPSLPGFSQLYNLYFYNVMPIIGKLSYKKYDSYAYLAHSLTHFPGQEELKGIMLGVGLKQVRYWNLFMGTMACHIGVKQA